VPKAQSAPRARAHRGSSLPAEKSREIVIRVARQLDESPNDMQTLMRAADSRRDMINWEDVAYHTGLSKTLCRKHFNEVVRPRYEHAGSSMSANDKADFREYIKGLLLAKIYPSTLHLLSFSPASGSVYSHIIIRRCFHNLKKSKTFQKLYQELGYSFTDLQRKAGPPSTRRRFWRGRPAVIRPRPPVRQSALDRLLSDPSGPSRRARSFPAHPEAYGYSPEEVARGMAKMRRKRPLVPLSGFRSRWTRRARSCSSSSSSSWSSLSEADIEDSGRAETPRNRVPFSTIPQFVASPATAIELGVMRPKPPDRLVMSLLGQSSLPRPGCWRGEHSASDSIDRESSEELRNFRPVSPSQLVVPALRVVRASTGLPESMSDMGNWYSHSVHEEDTSYLSPTVHPWATPRSDPQPLSPRPEDGGSSIDPDNVQTYSLDFGNLEEEVSSDSIGHCFGPEDALLDFSDYSPHEQGEQGEHGDSLQASAHPGRQGHSRASSNASPGFPSMFLTPSLASFRRLGRIQHPPVQADRPAEGAEPDNRPTGDYQNPDALEPSQASSSLSTQDGGIRRPPSPTLGYEALVRLARDSGMRMPPLRTMVNLATTTIHYDREFLPRPAADLPEVPEEPSQPSQPAVEEGAGPQEPLRQEDFLEVMRRLRSELASLGVTHCEYQYDPPSPTEDGSASPAGSAEGHTRRGRLVVQSPCRDPAVLATVETCRRHWEARFGKIPDLVQEPTAPRRPERAEPGPFSRPPAPSYEMRQPCMVSNPRPPPVSPSYLARLAEVERFNRRFPHFPLPPPSMDPLPETPPNEPAALDSQAHAPAPQPVPVFANDPSPLPAPGLIEVSGLPTPPSDQLSGQVCVSTPPGTASHGSAAPTARDSPEKTSSTSENADPAPDASPDRGEGVPGTPRPN